MKGVVFALMVSLAVPALAQQPVTLGTPADTPAPAAIAVVLLGMVGLARRRRR